MSFVTPKITTCAYDTMRGCFTSSSTRNVCACDAQQAVVQQLLCVCDTRAASIMLCMWYTTSHNVCVRYTTTGKAVSMEKDERKSVGSSAANNQTVIDQQLLHLHLTTAIAQLNLRLAPAPYSSPGHHHLSCSHSRIRSCQDNRVS